MTYLEPQAWPTFVHTHKTEQKQRSRSRSSVRLAASVSIQGSQLACCPAEEGERRAGSVEEAPPLLLLFCFFLWSFRFLCPRCSIFIGELVSLPRLVSSFLPNGYSTLHSHMAGMMAGIPTPPPLLFTLSSPSLSFCFPLVHLTPTNQPATPGAPGRGFKPIAEASIESGESERGE